MATYRCPTFGRRLSLALVALLLVGLVAPPGTIAVRRAAAASAAKTVLAFPATDESDKKDLGEAAARVTSALALTGQDVPELDLEMFSDQSPTVRRALSDGALRQADIEGPKDAKTALIIGKALRVDTVVLVGVQSLTYSGQPRQAEIAVTGTEYRVATNVDPDTGQIVAEPKGTAFGVSGVAKSPGKKSHDDAALVRAAAANAAQKTLSVLAGRSAEVYAERGVATKKKSGAWRWVAIGLVVVGLAIVAGTAHHEKAGPPVNDLLPTRISAQATPGQIRISWVPPATTTKQIFKYEIQRSDNGGFFHRVDNDQLGPTATFFADFGVTAGVAYAYQIRVLYTDGTITPWVPSETIQIIAV